LLMASMDQDPLVYDSRFRVKIDPPAQNNISEDVVYIDFRSFRMGNDRMMEIPDGVVIGTISGRFYLRRHDYPLAYSRWGKYPNIQNTGRDLGLDGPILT